MSTIDPPASALASDEVEPFQVRLARRWRRFKRNSTPYLFLAPFLVGFLIFMVYPLLYALNLSLYRTKIVGGTTFIGLENYGRAFQDPAFWEGVRNVLVFGFMQIPVMLGLALVFALLLDSPIIRRQTIFRLVYFLPFAVPSVVAALIWGYLYGQSFGPLAQIARVLNMPPPLFLSPTGIIPAIANIATWQYTGYNMLIMYAALKAIPHDLYEAARVDGASGWQIALKIRIPLIAPAIILTFIFSIIGTLQLFNEPRILIDIAPTALKQNFTPNLYVYTLAFENRQFDYSAAIAFSLAMVTAVLSSLVLFFTYRREVR
ncbi:MAG TPA: sugar ABC transporter permease [Anaerolineae bacterium]|nr:sugar ABC transporter permease [Anaerolineae bacterium]